MSKTRLNKRQANSLDNLLSKIAQTFNKDEAELKAAVNPLYTVEDHMYVGQAVLNFYRARIAPFMEKGEKPENFDKRFKEWRFRVCDGCGQKFAYAFNYDGVSHCSLECLEASLAAIGIKFSRHHDLKKRWGVFFHPAIVPASALEALHVVYSEQIPSDSESFGPDLPNPRVPDNELQRSDTNA